MRQRVTSKFRWSRSNPSQSNTMALAKWTEPEHITQFTGKAAYSIPSYSGGSGAWDGCSMTL